MCSLQDSRLARSCSLSVGGAAPRAAGFLFGYWPWPPSYGVDVAAGGTHRQADGSRTCARSKIPGWHDRALYPLAGRRRAPPDFFLAIGHGRRATGSTSPPAARTGKLMGLGRVLAPRFRLARSCSLSVGGAAPRAAGFLFGYWPWPPSYGVDVAAGGTHRQADGSRTCARSKIPGWHDRALYPLAGRRRAPPDFFLAIGHGRRATGSTSPPAARTGKLMGLGRVLAPRFQAGTIVLFIRWRGGAARRRISFWLLAMAAELRGRRRRRRHAPAS